MKFHKGNLVEVLRREHNPCGSWFPASIVSADGDNFIVRFKFLINNEGERVVEKVPKRDVRPRPSHVKRQAWAVGDIVEVFDAQCWRVGKVGKVLHKNNRVVIRFFGSIQLKEFDVSNLRIRQVWCDSEWKMIGKVIQEKQVIYDSRSNNSDVARGFLLRTPSEVRCRNLDTREKDGEGRLRYQANSIKSFLPMKTVSKSFVPHYEENFRGVHVGGISKKRKTHPSRGRGKATTHSIYNCRRPLQSTEDSDQCSVASCSSNGMDDYRVLISRKTWENSREDSDAESSFPSTSDRRYLARSPEQRPEPDIHELELHAYKTTMEAMYALGPLSWDQESLLTNLRLFLHISDEEHLFQLRHLLSSQVL